ncbi:MAG TPA: glycosyltransferase family 4 protein [Thermoanaerobaculia bacterium]|jgi:glycosyltransferase involved in cell wall biosynthesis|nr:glycosyltransferase family 4 protein [Thermoanaerobaculia bacterium]
MSLPAAKSPLALDYLSPLPPVRSGIADYSMDLLPHLAARADVRLLALAGQPVAPEVRAAWHPKPSERAGEGGRLPLYHMGNNRYHEDVLRLALYRPGVVVLHDLVLHHLRLDTTLGRERGREDFDLYCRLLAEDEGWIGTATALAKRWSAYADAPVFALAARRTLLRRQRGILVHGEWAARELSEEDPDLRVRAVPMGIPLPPAADAEAGRRFRARYGLPLDAPLLGSFGFQTPIKRTGVAIEALAAPGLERVHLLIVGESSGLKLDELARAAGVAERVTHLGFLPFDQFEAAIAASDLCLNLRYPTAGETSASLLRVLAVGRPAIVSDYAQFAELPEEIALKVPLGKGEGAALASALRELLAQPDRLRAMGEAARAYVAARHDPGAAAEAIVAACAEWCSLPPPDDLGPRADGEVRAAEAPPPTSLTWHEFPGDLSVAGAELPWAPGERRQLTIRLANRGFARWLAGERGPGGLALVVKLFEGGEGGQDLLSNRHWLALPRDLDPGEETVFSTAIRRPPGPARLRIEPHLFGGLGFSRLSGPWWERDL